MLSSVAARLYHDFPHYLIKGTILEKKIIAHKQCILIFSTKWSETYLILGRNERDMTINVHRSSCKMRVILATF
jgi:hypothetical protein